jgi:hypothetical protein
MHNHVQARAFCPAYSKFIEVDAGILQLLIALWNARIYTCNSCEEIEPGIIWIEFYSNEDIQRFLLILIQSLEDQIHNNPEADNWMCYRILGQEWGYLRSWQYFAHPNISPAKCNQKSIFPKRLKGCRIELSVSLRFPKEDHSKVLDVLRSYVYKSKYEEKSNISTVAPINVHEYMKLIETSKHASKTTTF